MSQRQAECYVCVDCGEPTFDRQDIKEGYCPNCGDWTRNDAEPVYITEREDC